MLKRSLAKAWQIQVQFFCLILASSMPPRKKWHFETANYSSPLVAGRCHGETPTKRRCKRKACLGYPLCHAHNASRYGVQSRVSTIPGAGRGLFATRKLSKDSWLCPYVGENTTMSFVHLRYPGEMTAPYVVGLPNGLAVDSACLRGIGSLANALFSDKNEVLSVSRHNTVLRYRSVGDGIPGMWLKTTKLIKPGDEIFLWYGHDYKLQQGTHKTTRA